MSAARRDLPALGFVLKAASFLGCFLTVTSDFWPQSPPFALVSWFLLQCWFKDLQKCFHDLQKLQLWGAGEVSLSCSASPLIMLCLDLHTHWDSLHHNCSWVITGIRPKELFQQSRDKILTEIMTLRSSMDYYCWQWSLCNLSTALINSSQWANFPCLSETFLLQTYFSRIHISCICSLQWFLKFCLPRCIFQQITCETIIRN